MEDWRTVKVERPDGEGVSVAEFRWGAWDDLWIRLEDGTIHKSHDQGETWETISTSWHRTVSWRWRLKSWWWRSWILRSWYRLRYVVTGNCGHHCHMGHIAQYAESDDDGNWISLSWSEYRLIPEADCPVHDNDLLNIEGRYEPPT